MTTASTSLINATFMFFGPLAEQLGMREKTVSLPTTLRTLKDLRAWLLDQGMVALVEPHIAVAVNGTKLEHDLTLLALTPPCEVAFLPPVTGG